MPFILYLMIYPVIGYISKSFFAHVMVIELTVWPTNFGLDGVSGLATNETKTWMILPKVHIIQNKITF